MKRERTMPLTMVSWIFAHLSLPSCLNLRGTNFAYRFSPVSSLEAVWFGVGMGRLVSSSQVCFSTSWHHARSQEGGGSIGSDMMLPGSSSSRHVGALVVGAEGGGEYLDRGLPQ
jgi:hypothetical protein